MRDAYITKNSTSNYGKLPVPPAVVQVPMHRVSYHRINIHRRGLPFRYGCAGCVNDEQRGVEPEHAV